MSVTQKTKNDAFFGVTSDMTFEKAKESADYLLAKSEHRPKVGIICGSGLGILSRLVGKADQIKYSDIPHFPECTAPGHESTLFIGHLNGVQVVLMKGRFHLYEGYSVSLCSMPVRVMKLMGVDKLLITNAAGGLNPDYKTGDIMLIKDHINFPGFSGCNPLCGPNDDKFGPRFFGLSDCYDPDLRRLAHRSAGDLEMKIKEGSYAFVGGPSFETPAELRMMKVCGIDAVGMSTVYEAITARHCGMEVVAFSIISNECVFEVDEVKKTPEELAKLANEVLDAVEAREKDLTAFVSALVKGMQ